MKNPFEVLKSKEQEMVKVKKEVDALRVTIRLIGDENAPAGCRFEGGSAFRHRNAVGLEFSFIPFSQKSQDRFKHGRAARAALSLEARFHASELLFSIN